MKKIILVLLLIIFITGCSDCPKGYEQDGNICKKEIASIEPNDGLCPDTYELKDNLCRKYAQIEIQ